MIKDEPDIGRNGNVTTAWSGWAPAWLPTMVPTVLACYLAAYAVFGERVPIANGLGYDGQYYGAFAANFWKLLQSELTGYHTNRLLPSFVVWSVTNGLGVRLDTPAAIVGWFHLYNSILLVGAALVWNRMCRQLGFKIETTLIGAICLFVNWAVLKQYSYFSVQTDVTAFALGVFVAALALERRLILLTGVAFVASFDWPTVFPVCALLVLFAPGGRSRPFYFRGERYIPFLAALVCCVLAVAAVFSGSVLFGASPPSLPVLPISLLVLFCFGYRVASAVPLTRFWPLRFASSAPILVFAGAWIVAATGLAVMRHYFVNKAIVDPVDLTTFLKATLLLPVAKPGVFLLAHVTHYGLAFAYLLFILPQVIDVALRHSLGVSLFVIATLVLALNSETRMLAFGYPMLVAVLCMALDQRTIGRSTVAALFIGNLVVSKFYLPLNWLGFKSPENLELLQTFPYQWVFMNIGPWMGWGGYFFNIGLLLPAIGAAVIIQKRWPAQRA